MQITTEQIKQDAKDSLDLKVVQARSMSVTEKFLAGADLFEEACRWTMMGIRQQFPDSSAEEHNAELRRRIEMM